MEQNDELNKAEDDQHPPFKIGKSTIDSLINKYLSRKFCEDVEYLQQKGGINWIEQALVTSISDGLTDDEVLKVNRSNAFDTNEPPQEEPISTK